MKQDLHRLQDAYTKVLTENIIDDIIIKQDMPPHEHHQCEAIEMAKTQVLNIKELLQLLGNCKDIEPWQASKLTIADDYVAKVKESIMFSK